jgi:tRNA G10  N-methylase Trm11
VKTETIKLGAAERVGAHPAKMHPALARALVEDYSAPDALVLDPFAGCGTTLHAARACGRKGYGVEIEAGFAGAAAKHGCMVQGDALALPFASSTFDAVVTSPPYGEAIGRAGDRAPEKTAANKRKYEEARFGKALTPHATYGTHPKNIGTLPLIRATDECFTQVMPKAISEMVRVVKPGGYVVVVVKDQRLGRQSLGVYDLPGDIVRWGAAAGALFFGRRFGIIPESSWTLWQRVNCVRWGHPVPDVEHVIVLKKKKGRGKS